MQQPTDPPAASEGPEPEPLPLVCPCGDLDHAPVRIGVAFSAGDPELGFYDCPQSASHRYGIGPVS